MKGVWMGWAKTGVAGLVLVAAVAGCQNKLYDQNKELMDENKALRDQNDAMRRQQQAQSAPPPAPQPLLPQQPVVSNPPPTATPAPTAPKPVEQIGGLETTFNQTTGNTTVHLPSDVFFDPGQATLKVTSKAALDKVVSALKTGKFAGKRIVVQGHTDSTPIRVSKWKSNQELSEARAGAVKDYLVSRGVTETRITTKGYGDTKPRSTDLSKNRRVEIVVLAAQ